MCRFERRVVIVLALAALPFAVAGGVSSAANPSSPPTVNATDWTATVPPATTAAATLNDVSCTFSTFCVAVGSETGNDASFIERWTGSSWTTVTTTPTSSAPPTLNAVSCVGSTFCAAVGSVPSTGAILIDQWDGSTWSTSAAPTPPSATNTALAGVSCLSATNCTAVGQFDAGSGAQPLAEQWNGSSWAIQTTPVPTGSTATNLAAVSCTSATFCMAVGEATSGSSNVTLTEQWNGTSWAIVSSPNGTLPSGSTALFAGVSCIGAAFCDAVGSTDGSGTQQTLVEAFDGTTWTLASSPSTSATEANALRAVDCFSMTTCTAVGSANTPSNGHGPLALVWNGSAWSLAASAPTSTDFAQSGVNGVTCLTDWQCTATGSYSNSGTTNPFAMTSPIVRSGYRFVASDGGVFAYGAGAPFLGSMGAQHLNQPIVGMAVTPAGDGYYLVASDGGVFSFGSAQFYGSTGGMRLNKPIVGMAVTPDGGGYWLVASDGGIFSFGDAQFYGSAGSITLNKPIVGMAPTSDGRGYYLAASDGGVFTYGDAQFGGSMGGTKLSQPVVGIVAPVSLGYYMVASDGGIFNFGPPFEGSTGAMKLNKPIVGMTTAPGGYYLSGSDGGVVHLPDHRWSALLRLDRVDHAQRAHRGNIELSRTTAARGLGGPRGVRVAASRQTWRCRPGLRVICVTPLSASAARKSPGRRRETAAVTHRL